MRLWSLHPRYLDAKGLTALWREGLLARKVLLGETRGYQHHPQLIRFSEQADPIEAMDAYLFHVVIEAEQRGYRFDSTKIASAGKRFRMAVTDGQLHYEWRHLLQKLQLRDPARFEMFRDMLNPEPHPLFTVTGGNIEAWEILPAQL